MQVIRFDWSVLTGHIDRIILFCLLTSTRTSVNVIGNRTTTEVIASQMGKGV
jgi:hypothetical protein